MKRIAYAFAAFAMIAGPAIAASEDDGDASPDKCVTVKETIHKAMEGVEGDAPTIIKLNHDQQLFSLGVLYLYSAAEGAVPKAFDNVTEVVTGHGAVLFWLKGKCITDVKPAPSLIVARLKTLGKTADDEE